MPFGRPTFSALQPLSPLSSNQAKPGDLRSPFGRPIFPLLQPLPSCHPERSRGTCGAPFGRPTFSALQPLSPLSSQRSRRTSAMLIGRCPSAAFHPKQNRHPERSASQICRITRVYGAKSKDLGDACSQMLFGAFRPQTRETKKSQPRQSRTTTLYELERAKCSTTDSQLSRP